MPDIEKVMSWLEGLAQDDWKLFYSDSEVYNTAKSALELLKEQQETIETQGKIIGIKQSQVTELLMNQQKIVRCKDCKNMKVMPCDIHGHIPIYCTNLGIYSEGLTWFCADGEQR